MKYFQNFILLAQPCYTHCTHPLHAVGQGQDLVGREWGNTREEEYIRVGLGYVVELLSWEVAALGDLPGWAGDSEIVEDNF